MPGNKPGKRSDVAAIVDYWRRREDECGLGVDWAEAHERCWRCGYKSALEMCHMVPASLGGSADPSNLVLLCGRCHREAPNARDPKYMWIWLRATTVGAYDVYWTLRGAQEFRLMYGRDPFAHLEGRDDLAEHARKLLEEEMLDATIHLGEGRMNPSTLAAVFARVEERLTGKPSVPLSTSANSIDLLKLFGFLSKSARE